VDPVGPYNLTGSINDIFGEGVGFAEIIFDWNGNEEKIYCDENGSFEFSFGSTAYHDGDLLYINATDGENMTSHAILLYSEDAGKYVDLTLNQYLVEITGPDSVSTIEPNGTITIPVKITNRGNTNSTFIVQTLEVPIDWEVSMSALPDNTMTLGVGETQTVEIEIMASGNSLYARGHQKYFISLLVYSELYPQRNDSFAYGIEVLPIQALIVTLDKENSSSAAAVPGEVIGFQFIVENLGNEGNTFIPALLGNTVQDFQFNASYLSIDIGGQARFSLVITTPYLASGSIVQLEVGGEEAYIENAEIQLTILELHEIECSYPGENPGEYPGETPDELSAAPGEELSIPLTIINTGNIHENITISAENTVPGISIPGGSIDLDMQEEEIFSPVLTIPTDALSSQIISVIFNLTTDSDFFLTFEVNITVLEVRSITLTLIDTTIIPGSDFSTYQFDIEAENTGNGINTFYFRVEGSHPGYTTVPDPVTLSAGERETIQAYTHVPLDSTNVFDNYVVPMDEHSEYGELNLRILSYVPDLEITVEMSQDVEDYNNNDTYIPSNYNLGDYNDYYENYYYYTVSVSNIGERFEWLSIDLGLPNVDSYQTGDARWEGNSDKDLLGILPGETQQFTVRITTPDHREYWGSDLSVTLNSESGKTEKVLLHKPPIAILSATISDPVSFEDTISFTGSQSLWNIEEYVWDFGDGTIVTGSSASHSFGESGVQMVRLTVTDSENLTASRTISIEIENSDPIAIVQVQPKNRTVELDNPVKLDGSFSQDRDGVVISYLWEFGEVGEYYESPYPIIEHTFGSIGVYIVTLQVTDNFGANDNVTSEITVIPKTEDPTSPKDEISEEESTTDFLSYVPIILCAFVLAMGSFVMYRKKTFVDHISREISERSGKQ